MPQPPSLADLWARMQAMEKTSSEIKKDNEELKKATEEFKKNTEDLKKDNT